MPIKQQNAKLSNGNTREALIARLPIPGPGRPVKTQEDRIIEKAVKEYITEHEQALAEALPGIRPALVDSAKKGNMQAIQEIHKVVGAHKRGDSPMFAVQFNLNEQREKYK